MPPGQNAPSAQLLFKLLEMMRCEAEGEEPQVARENLKVRAMVATVVCASLRGPEVFQLDLAGMREHIGRGRDSIYHPSH
jgi:hypothetical protein